MGQMLKFYPLSSKVTDLDSIAGAIGAAELYGTFSYE